MKRSLAIVGCGVAMVLGCSQPGLTPAGTSPGSVVLHPQPAVRVVSDARLSVAQQDQSGNLTIKVPAGYEQYAQQFANKINQGGDVQQAYNELVQTLKAAGAPTAQVLQQVGQLNPWIAQMAPLMGLSLPGITTPLQ